MKKYITFLLAVFTLASCEEEKQVKVTPQAETKLIKAMEPFFTQNITGNNLAEQKLADDAGKAYLDLLKDESALSDYPVFYEAGMEAGNGKKWVKFRTGYTSEEISAIPLHKFYDRVTVQIMAKMNDEKAQSLRVNTPYYLTGKLIKKGWQVSDGHYEFKPRYVDYNLDLNNITYEITSITEQKQ